MEKNDKMLEKAKAYANKVVITSQCMSCGIHYTETFEWFREQEFNCTECGGPIDDAPIIEFAENAIERLRKLKNQDSEKNS